MGGLHQLWELLAPHLPSDFLFLYNNCMLRVAVSIWLYSASQFYAVMPCYATLGVAVSILHFTNNEWMKIWTWLGNKTIIMPYKIIISPFFVYDLLIIISNSADQLKNEKLMNSEWKKLKIMMQNSTLRLELFIYYMLFYIYLLHVWEL